MKSIVVYFSRSGQNYFQGKLRNIDIGNTEVVAKYIQEELGCDVFKIIPVQAYSNDYNECIEQAKEDLERNARPELKEYLDSLDEYENIYLGFPNYWSTMPMCVFTFLEHYNFQNKKIYPFITHEGSGFGQSLEDLKRVCDNAQVKEGLSVLGSKVYDEKDKVIQWLKEGK